MWVDKKMLNDELASSQLLQGLSIEWSGNEMKMSKKRRKREKERREQEKERFIYHIKIVFFLPLSLPFCHTLVVEIF